MRSDLISRIVILSSNSPTDIGTRMSWGALMALPPGLGGRGALQHHSAQDTNPEDVEPTLREVGQVRVE